MKTAQDEEEARFEVRKPLPKSPNNSVTATCCPASKMSKKDGNEPENTADL